MSGTQGNPIVAAVLNGVFQSELVMPVYRADVVSEAYTTTMSRHLPLVFIWNENRQKGSFTVTVNGTLVEELLETQIDRGDPRFAQYRDEIMTLLSTATKEAVVETCQKLKLYPSEIY